MIHAREDYNRIQDPALDNPELLKEGATPIGKDEPVILFRAQDKFFIRIVEAYIDLLAEDDNGVGFEEYNLMSESLARQQVLAAKWQEKNGCKVPDI